MATRRFADPGSERERARERIGAGLAEAVDGRGAAVGAVAGVDGAHREHGVGVEEVADVELDTPIEAVAEELALVSDPRAEEFVGGRVVGLVWIQNVVGGLGEAVDGLAAGVHAAADRDAGESRVRGERVSLDHVH